MQRGAMCGVVWCYAVLCCGVLFCPVSCLVLCVANAVIGKGTNHQLDIYSLIN